MQKQLKLETLVSWIDSTTTTKVVLDSKTHLIFPNVKNIY